MNDESIMVAELAERVRDPSLKLIKSPTYDSLHTDGPCHPYTWCLGGKLCNGTMQPAAWRMVNHLLQQPDRADEYDELRQPVYGDPEHQADNNAFVSGKKSPCFTHVLPAVICKTLCGVGNAATELCG